MKELKFEELTIRQKLGMTMTACLNGKDRPEEDNEFVYDLIRNHSLGSVWIQQGRGEYEKYLKKIREIADYPILIITDAESGIGDYQIGRHNAIGTTGSEAHAYAFGKVVGVKARKMGYNVVCNPVLDMREGCIRSLGIDKNMVTKLAMAEAKGLHDGGVLTVGKHYPGGEIDNEIDSHMGESVSYATKEELLENALVPYMELYEAGLLDGAMVGHTKLENVDNEYPASLSKKVIDIIREKGYNGFFITDALCMMGIRAKFGDVESKALAINAGIDLLLPYVRDNKVQYEMYFQAYDDGMISDECLDAAVKRVLDAQHKTTLLPADSKITNEDTEIFNRINKDGIYNIKDDNVSTTISRDGKHYFVIVVKQETDITNSQVEVDTFSGGWLDPYRVEKKIKELFPNSICQFIHEFPAQRELQLALSQSIGCDKLVVVTFSEFVAYAGKEYLTHRIVNLINSMQLTDRISTLIHFGNPMVLDELSHIPNIIFGGLSKDSVDTAFEVLAGVYQAKGKPTYKVDLK